MNSQSIKTVIMSFVYQTYPFTYNRVFHVSCKDCIGPRMSHVMYAVVTLIAANCRRRKVWNATRVSGFIIIIIYLLHQKVATKCIMLLTAQAWLPSVRRHYKGHASFMCVWVVPIVPCGCKIVSLWNCIVSTYSCNVHSCNFSHPS